jgi:hypothetical protein
MIENAKISVDKVFFDKIVSEIKALGIICMDEYVKTRLLDLNKNLEQFNKERCKVNVEEQIANKMEEVKGKDSDLNARLYILYQDLKRGKLSEEEALEIFERNVKHQDFDRMLY